MPRARRCGEAGRLNAAILLSVLMVALGVAAIVRTVSLGVGGGFGLLLGAALIAAGAARIWLARRAH